MIGNKFYTWFKNYYQWVGGAFNETLLLPLVRATNGLRAGAIRYDEVTDTVETYDGTNWNPIPSATGFVPNSRTITINGETQDLSINRIYSVGTVTSVGLTAPAAFNVSGSPVTGSGTLALTAAGLASEYVRGDGTLANFPTTTGGGSSVSYYLNGSVNQGTFAGNTYYELSKTPILGAGTNFTRNSNGYIASFITDANDPDLLEIPAGNWNFEIYFSASSSGGNPTYYIELSKWDGSGFTAIASSQSSAASISRGTNKDAYFSALAVPQTSLNVTDRLAIRIFVQPAGRTITMHTENNNLCQVITTFSTGLKSINGLTDQVQYFATGTSGNDFNIVSANDIHTFNIPTASASNRGALNATDWAIFNAKQNALTLTVSGSSGASTLVGATLNVPEYTLSGLGGVPTSRTITINGTTQDLSANRTYNVGTVTSVGLTTSTTGVTIGSTPVTGSGNITIDIATASGSTIGLLSASDWTTFNNKQNAITLTTSGSSGAATLIGSTLNVPQYQAAGNYITALTGEVTASGPGSASATLTNSAVIGKVLTGLNLTGGGTIAATDSILEAFGKVQNQISAMVGGVIYKGTWNASTNTPTLTSGTGSKGDYYIVTVDGSTNLDGITDWKVGDWAIFNGTTWDKVDNTDAVSSVNGFTGAVSLSTTHIGEGTNLYYTDARARAAITLTTTGNSGSATYTSGVLNVPTYTLSGLGGVPTTRTLTINGTAFDLSADRSWSVGTVTSVGLSSATSGVTIGSTPVTGSGTITLAIATASGSQQGLLSSTDWTTFNNKQNALTNPVTGTGASGQVSFWSGTNTQAGSANLIWTNASNLFGVTGTYQHTNATASQDGGVLGSELLTSSGWTTTGWTGDFTTGFTNGAGNTTALSNSFAAVIGTAYQIAYTITGRTAGSVTIALGGQSTSGVTATGAFGPTATTTGNLVITPTSDFNGTIVLSVRTISNGTAGIVLRNSSGTVTNEIRISSLTTNTFIGSNAGRRNTTGINNAAFALEALRNNTTGSNNSAFGVNALLNNTTGVSNSAFGLFALLNNTTGNFNSAVGVNALQSNTTGASNSAFGRSTLQSNTTGGDNSAFGVNALLNNTTGGDNAAFGRNALQNNTTGASNSAFGRNALLNNTTGSNNVALGLDAGRFTGTGTTAMTSVSNSIYVGFQTRGAAATGTTNEIVIGNNVVGLGSNTTVLGNSSTTLTAIYGALITGGTSVNASAQLQIDSTTRGFLPPRMTTTQQNAIASPATGLIVYDTTVNLIDYYNGSAWVGLQPLLTNPITGIGMTGQVPYFTGGTTLQGSNVYWDASNGRLGVGTATPGVNLDVRSSSVSTPSFIAAGNSDISKFISIYGGTSVDAVSAIWWKNGQSLKLATATSNDGASESIKMLITDAGNVGIGETNPASYKLQVKGPDGQGIQYEDSNGVRTLLGSFSSKSIIGTLTNHSVGFWSNNQERMILNTSGNLGLGVTPSAWESGFSAIEVDNVGNAIFGRGGSDMRILSNAYFDGAYKYAVTAAASTYQQTDGKHIWFQAPSGTAGNAISFTQAMTLDASGRLGIGTQSPAGILSIKGTTNNTVIEFDNGGASKAFMRSYDRTADAYKEFEILADYILLSTGSSPTERMRITSAGAVEMTGTIKTGAPSGGTAQAWKLGSVGTQALTQSKYVEAEINGTTYWLLATDVQV
jgi:hypothetical protein